ncbi:hypothetical protein LTR86_004217 [Recurvomyces mirabilis]|nr:hypothetical protein LTR86_004217 [Recurvomyces mirabilis]
MSWKQTAHCKREALLASIPQEWRLSPEEVGGRTKQRSVVEVVAERISTNVREITEQPVAQLLQRLCKGHVTAIEVLTHCLSEYQYQDARKSAAMLDEYWRVHQKPIGPLHGLPVSLMDRFNIAGLDSTCGYVSGVGKPLGADDEGVLVKRLRTLGAVILCKTSVPMSSMVS